MNSECIDLLMTINNFLLAGTMTTKLVAGWRVIDNELARTKQAIKRRRAEMTRHHDNSHMICHKHNAANINKKSGIETTYNLL